MSRTYVGIDVGRKRGSAVAVIDETARVVETGWIEPDADLASTLHDLVDRFDRPAFGIDGPRMPLPAPREWYWQRSGWSRRIDQEGWGRHCEVVVSAHRLARPQWTPLESAAPEWMQVGFEMFRILEPVAPAHEVFPSAAYTLLDRDPSARLDLSLAGFRRSPKDVLDATVAALVVRELAHGRGCEVGGGDGLGTIALPRPIPSPIEAVCIWPEQSDRAGD